MLITVTCEIKFFIVWWLKLPVKLNSDCRVLGLQRVPLTVGRVIDLEDDILPVATERLRNTFFTNGLLPFIVSVYHITAGMISCEITIIIYVCIVLSVIRPYIRIASDLQNKLDFSCRWLKICPPLIGCGWLL